MGGHAFDKHNPPLPTPRMPPQIYTLVLSQTIGALRTCYAHAESPIEAPDKTSYGDIDITVTSPLDPSYDPAHNREVAKSLSEVLNARAYVGGKGVPIQSYAIKWPVLDGEEEKYIQVDVQYLPTYPQFQWHLFHSAHGDLWNMLGSTIRPFGLTVNDNGMYLRIPEIELLDRNKAKVFLISDPGEILRFLGLDEEKWWSRFESKESMFEYAASSRFFWVKPAKEVDEAEGDVVGEIPVVIGTAEPEGQEGGADGKKKLKHNDRKRMNQRPIFAQWIDEFIPRCRETGLYTTPKVTREEVRVEAFEKFGVKEEYEQKLQKWNLERHRDELWRGTIKGSIPEEGVDPQFRSAAIRTLKGIIMEGAMIEGVETPDAVKCREDGFWDLEAVRKWVVESWEDVGKVGWRIQLEKAREKQLKKEAKRKIELAEEASRAAVKVA